MSMSSTIRRACALALAAFPALSGSAQEQRPLTPHDVARIRSASSAEISPDGRHIAYTLSLPRKPLESDDGPPWSELHVIELETSTQRPFVTGKVNVTNVAWTPDGEWIAFLSKRGEDKQTSLYVIPLDGGEARRAVSLEGAVQSYSFNPAGDHVAVVAAPPEDPAQKKLQDKGFKQEIYEEDWKPNEVWIAHPLNEDSKPRRIEIEGHVYQALWSPAGDRLLVARAPTPLVDDQYMRQRVAVVRLPTKEAPEAEVLASFENPGKLGAIGWSPDGRYVAMIAASDVHDPLAGRLLVAPASGGALVDLLPGFEGDVGAFAWQDAGTLMIVASQGVWTAFEKVDVEGGEGVKGKKTLVPAGGPVLASLSLSKDGRKGAFLGSAPEHPSEVFFMQHGDGGPRRLTSSNPWLAEVRLAPQEVVRFQARDGLELEGLLIRPAEAGKGRRCPLILYVHGGPEAHHSNGWLTSYGNPGQVAAARGIATLHVNYRGSTGRGVAFSKLSQGDPAGKEFDDLIDAVDHLVETGLVDPAKVGVTGGSYGGYATAWLSTRYSERIAAGVMFVGISDKVSKVGTTDIPDEEFYVHALKRPWDDWDFMLERSPIVYAGQCRTPLLILHGKDDPRVNPGQSRELYRHLKLRGQAPVRLVFYPGEGHGNRKAAARLDYNLRCLQWLEHYLTGPAGALPPFELSYEEPKATDS